MAVFAPGGLAPPSTVTAAEKTSLSITSSTMSAAVGTETSIVIPSGTKAFSLRVRSDSGIAAKLKIATTSGNTLTDDYFSLMPGTTWQEDFTTGNSALTLYIASSKASSVVQIMLWS